MRSAFKDYILLFIIILFQTIFLQEPERRIRYRYRLSHGKLVGMTRQSDSPMKEDRSSSCVRCIVMVPLEKDFELFCTFLWTLFKFSCAKNYELCVNVPVAILFSFGGLCNLRVKPKNHATMSRSITRRLHNMI